MKKNKLLVALASVAAIFSFAGCEALNGSSQAPSTSQVPSSSVQQPQSSVVVPSSTVPVQSSEAESTEKTVYSQDFTDVTTVQNKPSSTSHGTMYLDDSSKGMIAVTGDSKYAKISGDTADTTLYVVTEGLDNGQIVIDFDFALGGVKGSWTFFQIYGISEKHTDAEVFSFRTAKDDSTKETYIGYRPDKDVSLATGFNNRLIYTGSLDVWHHANVSIDTATGSVTATITVNGTEYTATFEDKISEAKSLKFMAKSGVHFGLDNIVVKHTQGKFTEVKAKKIADLDKIYNAIDLTKYTTNGATLTAKYNEVKEALNATTSFAEVNSVYTAGVAAIKEIKSDAEIAAEALLAAQTAAKTAVKAYYDNLVATNYYTAAELTELTDLYKVCITAIEEETNVQAVEGLIADAKASLDGITHTGTAGDAAQVTKYEFTANTLALSGSLTENFTDSNFFEFVVNSDGKSKVTTNNKEIDGISYTQRFQIGGKTSASAGGYIKFTITAEAEVVVYAMSGSSNTDRPIMIWDSLETLDAPKVQESNDGNQIGKLSTTLQAGTYYIGSTTGAINIYGVIVTVTQ